jgi:hypothetical protein
MADNDRLISIDTTKTPGQQLPAEVQAEVINLIAVQPDMVGPTGPAGPQGPTGPAGPDGPVGPAGQSVTIIGSVPTVADLPTGLNNTTDVGKGWITSVNPAGHLHVWGGTSWSDVGLVQGPAGPQGATGATGAAGPKGDTGAAGPAGTSAVVVGQTCVLHRSSDLTMTSGLVGVPWDDVGINDDNMWLSADGWVIRPKRVGRYLVGFHLTMTGSASRIPRIELNTAVIAQAEGLVSSGAKVVLTVTVPVVITQAHLDQNSYLGIRVDNGGTGNRLIGGLFSSFWATYQGPGV